LQNAEDLGEVAVLIFKCRDQGCWMWLTRMQAVRPP
jgi:hypothetical protein